MAYFLVLSALTAIVVVIGVKFDRVERNFIFLGHFAHTVATFGMFVVMTYFYSGGDMMLYHDTGGVLANMVKEQPELFGDLLSLATGGKPRVFEFIPAFRSSTGVMIGVAAVLHLLLSGSFLASCLVLSGVAYFGQVWLYLGFREHLPQIAYARAAIAAFCMPSVVFWSSGLLKEAVSLGGLGLAFYGVSGIVKAGRLKVFRLLAILIGGWTVGIIKAYILFPLALGGAFWFATERSRRRHGKVSLKFSHLLAGGLIGLALVTALGELFPRFSFENLGTETASLQQAYRTIDAGSSFGMGFEGADSLQDQIIFAPVALVSSLLRPFIFEAHNLMALISALETSVLLFLWIFLFQKIGIRRIVKRVKSEPLLIFCLVFFLIFAVAVGLAAPNLGTLSRYRIPMFPIYGLFVLLLVPFKRGERKGPARRFGHG